MRSFGRKLHIKVSVMKSTGVLTRCCWIQKPGTWNAWCESNPSHMPQRKSETSEKQTALAKSSPSRRQPTRARSSLFKYYIHDSVEGYRLQLMGELTEADVPELDGCWRTARTTIGTRKLVLDVRLLQFADDSGKRWLLSMASEGATYLPDSFLRNGLPVQAAEHAAGTKSSRKSGVFGKIVSVLKGIETEPTQAQ